MRKKPRQSLVEPLSLRSPCLWGIPSQSTLARRAVSLLLITFHIAVDATPATNYPLKISANRRYLVDATGNPFLMVGDSAWSLLVNLNASDTSFYLHSRATNGFNTIMCSLISVPYTGGRWDGSMLDNILPFTNNINGQFDLTAINPAYFSAVSNV